MKTENRQFKMLSLFDGSGGFPLAATLCGIEPIYAAEIEPFPIKVTKARFPHMKHLGDISKINGADLEPVDVVTGGSPCFIAGTLIQTDKGLLPIEDVKIGDRVLTHTNTYQTVEKIGNQPSNNIIKIKMMGSPVITTTENHPFYTKRKHGVEWIQAKDLRKGDFVGFAINKECRNDEKYTEDECYQYGKGIRYIKIAQIPQSIIDLPTELLERVFEGYIQKDTQKTTSSKTFAYQLQQIFAKVYKKYAEIRIKDFGATGYKEYIVDFPKEYDEYIYQDGMLWIPFIESETIGIPETVYNMQVANDNSYTAYNFTVHNCQDMSVAGKRQGMSKKCPNCDYSVVGNEDIKECPECGTELEYTRSGLFMEQIRVIKEMREKDELGRLRSGRTDKHIRPRIMLWENVVGAFSSNKGEDFRAVLEETARIVDKTAVIPRPKNGKWATEGCIMGDGYSIAWRVLDSQHWGVPQRRRRIALVGDFGGQCAGEILFKRKGLSRNFTESRKAWQSLTRYITESVGETGECGVNIPYDMTHANDVIREYKDGICPTLQHRMGTGGNNQPIVNIPKKAYNIGAYNSKGMLSDNPHSGIYEADTSRTLDLNGGNPACNQGGIMVVEPVKTYDVRISSEGTKNARCHCYETDTSRTVDRSGNNPDSNHGGVAICEPVKSFHLTQDPICMDDKTPCISNGSKGGQATVGVCYSLQGNMIGREDHNGPQGSGINEDVSFTLNTTDRHAVAYRNSGFAEYVSSSSSSTLKAAGGDLGGGSETLIAENKTYRMESFGQYSESDKASCIKSRDHKDATDLIVEEPEYIVRRLTPLECSRLQGFPDTWIDNIAIENPTEEDLVFWREVFETHRKIVTGAEKPKTDKQIMKWLKEPDTDGAKYKLWGNGIALPCFWYVMEGIKEILEREWSEKN